MPFPFVYTWKFLTINALKLGKCIVYLISTSALMLESCKLRQLRFIGAYKKALVLRCKLFRNHSGSINFDYRCFNFIRYSEPGTLSHESNYYETIKFLSMNMSFRYLSGWHFILMLKSSPNLCKRKGFKPYAYKKILKWSEVEYLLWAGSSFFCYFLSFTATCVLDRFNATNSSSVFNVKSNAF